MLVCKQPQAFLNTLPASCYHGAQVLGRMCESKGIDAMSSSCPGGSNQNFSGLVSILALFVALAFALPLPSPEDSQILSNESIDVDGNVSGVVSLAADIFPGP
ncbi:hypothetical protein ABKN59_003239 [Abortiporus biennis]